MALVPPNLDDLTFDDIYNEALSRIPRYTPESTNYNDADPGITLVQLFAWMTDALVYRVNQVPELNYIKFLQLIGVNPNPAEPAHTELTFTLARTDVDTVIVPQGAQAAVAGSSPPVVFETDSALVALGAQLSNVLTFDGFDYIDATSANAPTAQPYQPFGPVAGAGSALLLGFSTPLTFTTAQVDLAVFTPPTSPTPLLADLAAAPVPPPATIAWEYYDGTAWRALVVVSDATLALTQSGHVVLQGPGGAAGQGKFGDVTRGAVLAPRAARRPVLRAAAAAAVRADQHRSGDRRADGQQRDGRRLQWPARAAVHARQLPGRRPRAAADRSRQLGRLDAGHGDDPRPVVGGPDRRRPDEPGQLGGVAGGRRLLRLGAR